MINKRQEIINKIDFNNITWAEFEELSLDYIRKIYNEKNTKIESTPLTKDGGKDIIVTHLSKIGEYRAWIECKKHKDKLGLAEISKNILLVMFEGINKIIFISASAVTDKAKQYILEFSTAHSFDAQFLDGDLLKFELLAYPEIINKYFEIDDFRGLKSTKLYTNYFISEFKDDRIEGAEQKYGEYYLYRKTDFYMYVTLMNKYNHPIEIVSIIPEYNQLDFKVTQINVVDRIAAKSDRVIGFYCESRNDRAKKKLPYFIITYINNGKEKTKKIETGILNTNKVKKIPFVGGTRTVFLNETINEVIEKTENGYLQIVYLYGESGVGKSRLLEEIESKFEKRKFTTKHINCLNYSTNRIIKTILATLLQIPFDLSISQVTDESIARYLSFLNVDENNIQAIKKLLLYSEMDSYSWQFVKKIIIKLINKKNVSNKYLFCFDNIQRIDHTLYELFCEIAASYVHNYSNCCIVVSENIDYRTELSSELYNNVIDLLSTKSNIGYIFKLEEMTEGESKQILDYYFPNIRNNTELHHDLLLKLGTKVYDIIMLCEFVKESELITHIGDDGWVISNPSKYYSFLSSTTVQYRDYTKIRLKYIENLMSNIEWFECKKIFMSLVIFNGILPYEIVEFLELREDIVSKLFEAKLIKFDYYSDNLTFYHDNLYRYFQNNPCKFTMKKVSSKIYQWLNADINCNNDIYDLVRFNCLVSSNNIGNILKYGMKLIEKLKNSYEMKKAVEIINILLDTKYYQNDTNIKFSLLILGAECYWETVDTKKALEFYEYAHEIIPVITDNESRISVCKYYHRHINVLFHLGNNDNAYTLLKEFEKINSKSYYEEFIVNNRYSVYYYRKGDFDKANQRIKESIKYAKKLKSDFWESTAYSEAAYNYLHNKKDVQCAIINFEKAVNLYHEHEDNTYYRILEILNQKATMYYLKHQYKEALSTIDASIEKCKSINNVYMEIKALNIKGIILSAYKKKVNDAIIIWKEALNKSTSIGADMYSSKLCFNIGAAYIALDNTKKAIDYLLKSFSLVKSFKVQDNKKSFLIPIYLAYATVCENDENLIKELKDVNIVNKHIVAIKQVANMKKYIESFGDGIFSCGEVEFLYST